MSSINCCCSEYCYITTRSLCYKFKIHPDRSNARSEKKHHPPPLNRVQFLTSPFDLPINQPTPLPLKPDSQISQTNAPSSDHLSSTHSP
ncbi:hypothetical protein KC19_10G140600 [Ceratodon purpureus]|uniref:Uncharacterized protein n=1 Tax=Ceratodon purpureus TaxID=3225 RepID=A0A8T0GLS7_CERPU|nr:hypothetical protein KC19_10G140600 [Ceratodon purpureus]